MKRFIVTATLVSFFIGLLAVYLVTTRGRGYEQPESSWDGPKVVHGILSQDECEYIMKKANNLFSRSSVIGIDGPSETRTSETAWIPKDDPVARKILSHACSLTGKPYENTEDLQVVRYTPGTYYRAHHDACCEESESCSMFENQGGQRVGTLLVYLNDDFTDGETHFPDHGDLKLKAPPGSAIFFEPLGSGDKCHPKALHAGLPISSGTKYVCNAWVREGPFK
jgi:prolyl 4-hydroxylase